MWTARNARRQWKPLRPRSRQAWPVVKRHNGHIPNGLTTRMLRLSILLAAGATAFAQQYSISTVAGGAPPATPASAVSTSIGVPHKLMVAGSNIYFSAGNSVFRMDSGGTLTL